jgi:hypothetical protein
MALKFNVAILLALACVVGVFGAPPPPDTCPYGVLGPGNDDDTNCPPNSYYCKYDSGILPGTVVCGRGDTSFTLTVVGPPSALTWTTSTSTVSIVAVIAKAGSGYCYLEGSPPPQPFSTPVAGNNGMARDLSHFSICWKPTTVTPEACFKCPSSYRVACVPDVSPIEC